MNRVSAENRKGILVEVGDIWWITKQTWSSVWPGVSMQHTDKSPIVIVCKSFNVYVYPGILSGFIEPAIISSYWPFFFFSSNHYKFPPTRSGCQWVLRIYLNWLECLLSNSSTIIFEVLKSPTSIAIRSFVFGSTNMYPILSLKNL